MQRRSLPEDVGQRLRIHLGDAARIQVAESALQLQRSAERLLHGHLLVEREADQQRQRIGGEQPVGLVVAGEVELVGSGER